MEFIRKHAVALACVMAGFIVGTGFGCFICLFI